METTQTTHTQHPQKTASAHKTHTEVAQANPLNTHRYIENVHRTQGNTQNKPSTFAQNTRTHTEHVLDMAKEHTHTH